MRSPENINCPISARTFGCQSERVCKYRTWLKGYVQNVLSVLEYKLEDMDATA